MAQKKITSFKAFHKLVPQIIEQLSRDNGLAIRAATNPLLAFEELGYQLTPAIQKQVEMIVRFPPKSRKRLKELEKEIYEIAGEQFNIDDEQSISKVLFKKLKLSKPRARLSMNANDMIRHGADYVKGKRPQWSDPLQEQANLHPIMSPLLKYRKIMAERPGFVPRDLYEQLKTGKHKLPISKIRIDFSGQHEDYDDA